MDIIELTQTLLVDIRSAIQPFEDAKIKQLSKSLFPVLISGQPSQILLHSLTTFVTIRLNKHSDMLEVNKQIAYKSREISPELERAVVAMMRPEFCERLKIRAVKEPDRPMRDITPSETTKDTKETSAKEGKENTLAKESKEKEKDKDKDKEVREIVILDGPNPTILPKNTRREGSAKSGRGSIRGRVPIGNDGETVPNLTDRGLCLCEKTVQPSDTSVHCLHCGAHYHLDCMKRKPSPRHCILCHLRRLLPNRQVRRTLFSGLLRKGKRRHEFSIQLQQQDLLPRYRIQIRCFRLKEESANIMLFPDSCSFTLNNHPIKEFTPLHRMSSLKHRKDEPFYVELRHLQPKENKVVILEKVPAKENREERIDSEFHVVGIYVVEERKVEAIVRDLQSTAVTSFEESKKVLDSAFRHGDISDVSCEVVKIPLTCTLSSEKLRIPARGLFCSHFQCFDLQNFMMLTAQSANPRWLCPLCKLPCYSLRLDCLLMALLDQYAHTGVTEVLFFKNGQLSAQAGDKPVKDKITNIYDLPVGNVNKRAAEIPVESERKKRKPAGPEPLTVIALDE